MENKELGRLVLKHVETFPETFDMKTWAVEAPCGTVACLAGWTLLLHGGYTFKHTPRGMPGFFNSEGRQVHAGSEARILLGLDNDEYHTEDDGPLFYDSNQNAVARLRVLVQED